MPISSISEDIAVRDAKVQDWINLVAVVGLLIGLVFVAVELRQNNELALSETIRELWYADNELDMFELENGLHELRIKSIEQPLDLSDDEISKLDKYLAMYLQHQIVVAVMRDSYAQSASTTAVQAADMVGDVLAGQFARGWFYANEDWINEYHPELVAEIKKEYARTPVMKNYTWPSEIRESVRQVVEGN